MASNDNLSPYLGLMTQAVIKPQGSMCFKTGAMDSVRGMTGLLQTSQGKRLAFAALVNGHATSVRDVRTSISILVNGLDQAHIEAAPAETKSDIAKPAPTAIPIPAGISADAPTFGGQEKD